MSKPLVRELWQEVGQYTSFLSDLRMSRKKAEMSNIVLVDKIDNSIATTETLIESYFEVTRERIAEIFEKKAVELIPSACSFGYSLIINKIHYASLIKCNPGHQKNVLKIECHSNDSDFNNNFNGMTFNEHHELKKLFGVVEQKSSIKISNSDGEIATSTVNITTTTSNIISQSAEIQE